MAKEDALYQEWINEFKAKKPEAAAALDALVQADPEREVFRGVLRERDYYTKLNDYNTEKQKLEAEKVRVLGTARQQQEWHTKADAEYKRAIQEKKTLTTRLRALEDKASEFGVDIESPSDGPGATSRGNGGSVVDENFSKELELLRGKVEFFDKALPKVLGDLTGVIRESLKEGYDVDPQDILAYASENNVDTRTAFAELTREEREKRTERLFNDELDKAREEGRREALSKLPGPDRIRQNGPTVVDALLDKDRVGLTNQERVSAAVKDFLEMGS